MDSMQKVRGKERYQMLLDVGLWTTILLHELRVKTKVDYSVSLPP
ncbi:MAG TPA: hypothetical protein VFG45_12760 [Candidatus Nitrosocosmicus sp.]|nr:hypothetical protein [Candidatus Nitrosocosmicus sp.]